MREEKDNTRTLSYDKNGREKKGQNLPRTDN
jgi:hypothetical protein